jgi:uncharacterized protein (DUF433 family)
MNSKITIDPSICHGRPVITGTRVLVSNIVADIAEGTSFADIMIQYPSVTEEDIKAAVGFCGELANFETVPMHMAK